MAEVLCEGIGDSNTQGGVSLPQGFKAVAILWALTPKELLEKESRRRHGNKHMIKRK